MRCPAEYRKGVDYRNLDLWKLAHRLTMAIYQATFHSPPTEQYGLTSQMLRSAFSIPMNIAEGCGGNSDGELRRSLKIALGSAAELEYQVLRCQELGHMHRDAATQVAGEIDHLKRLLTHLSYRLRPTPPRGG